MRSAAIADVRESCIASNRTAGVYCHSNAQVFLNVPLSLPLLHGIPHSAKYDKELERRQHGTNEQQLSESSPLVKQLSGLTQTKTTWLVGNGGAGLECKRYSHAVIESSRLCHNAGGGLLVLDNGNVDVRNSLISCNRKVSASLLLGLVVFLAVIVSAGSFVWHAHSAFGVLWLVTGRDRLQRWGSVQCSPLRHFWRPGLFTN